MSEIRLCVWCKTGRVKFRNGTYGTRRFCGTSCSAKWRMTQPKVRAAVFNSKVRAKVIRSTRQAYRDNPELGRRISERMTKKNPMRLATTRAKVSATLKAIKHTPKQGGNGRPLPLPQQKLAAALGWTTEFPVSLGKQRAGYPSNYKLDIANPLTKVGVEVDGPSHASRARQAQDRKKERALQSLGWLVLRVLNAEALSRTTQIAASIISRSAERVPMS